MLNQPSDKAQSKYFARLCTHLASTYLQVSKLYNSQADKPLWQARFFAIHAGTAVFIDLLDARTSTKPPTAVIHNRDYTAQVPQETLNHFAKFLEKCDTPFSIAKGVHFE